MSLNQFCLSVYYKIVLIVGLHNDPHLLLAYLTLSKFTEDLSEKSCCCCLVAQSSCIHLLTANLSDFVLISLVMEMAVNTPHVALAAKTGLGHDSMLNNHGISKRLLTQKYTAVNHLEHKALRHHFPL